MTTDKVTTTDEKVKALIAQIQPEAVGEWVCTNLLRGSTYRLTSRHGVTDLKVASDRVPSTQDPTIKARRMRWVQGRFPVPQVLDSGHQDDLSWLLTTQLPRVPAADQRCTQHQHRAVHAG